MDAQLAAPGSTRLTADIVRLAEGFVHVTSLGPVPVKGVAEACGGLRAARRGRAARPACRPPPAPSARDGRDLRRRRYLPRDALALASELGMEPLRAVCRVALAG